MKKYYVYLLLAIQFMPNSFKAQGTTFQQIYGATINQSGRDVVQTSDGGYLIASTTETSIVNDLDISITKTDNSGNITWTKSYGGNNPEYPNCILPISGGNFFILGYSQSYGSGDADMYLLKINSSGDTLWSRFYGGYGNEDGKEIVATADGNYAIIGASNSASFSDNNIELLKIDPSGAVLWTQFYGGPDYESARSVKLCSDGGFIIAGKTMVLSTNIAKLYVLKTDAGGDTIWTKTYTGPNSYEGKSILVNSDGSYTLCVDDSSVARDSDVRIMKISSTGAVIWNYMYGGTDKDICKMIQPTTGGGYIVAGISRSFGWVNPDMWLLKVNSLGDTIWTKHYGGAGHEHCFAARQTSDGGFIAIGHSKSFSANTEIMLVKSDSLGNIAPVAVNELASQEMDLNIYPNPADGMVYVDLSAVPAGSVLKISNSLGQLILKEDEGPITGNQHKVIRMENEKPGIYFITLQSLNGPITKKLILN